MSEQISWVLEVAILPGQLENFRAVAKDLVTATRNESDTLGYEWFLSADGTSCHIYERYKNSAAIMAHLSSFGPMAERFMQACRPTRFHIYGSPSDEVKQALADLGPVYLAKLDGFTR